MSDKSKNKNVLTPSSPGPSENSSSILRPGARKCWYVIRTKPRQETVSLTELDRSGFEALCPMRLGQPYDADTGAEPLFGMGFAGQDLLDQLPALRWKFANLSTFQKRRPKDFIAQADALDAGLAVTASGG